MSRSAQTTSSASTLTGAACPTLRVPETPRKPPKGFSDCRLEVNEVYKVVKHGPKAPQVTFSTKIALRSLSHVARSHRHQLRQYRKQLGGETHQARTAAQGRLQAGEHAIPDLAASWLYCLQGAWAWKSGRGEVGERSYWQRVLRRGAQHNSLIFLSRTINLPYIIHDIHHHTVRSI